MNRARESDPSWSQAEAYDAMVALPDDDFSKFLDLEDIDLDIPPFGSEDAGDGPSLRNAQGTPSGSTNSAMSGAYRISTGNQHVDPKTQGQELTIDMDQSHDSPRNMRYSDAGQYSQVSPHYQMYQGHGFNPQMGVPPTPNSVEMHPDAVRYFQQLYIQQGGGMNDQQYQSGKNDMVNFTPLISPEVPANDSPYSFVPEFTVPGAYLSPLTSPALGPQGSKAPYYESRTANNSVTASPIDGPFGGPEELPNAEERPRKTRRKTAVPRSSGPAPKQPAVSKGRRRRGTLSTDIPSKDVSRLFTEVQHRNMPRSQPSSAHPSAAPSRSGSVFNTASPELLPETSMAPPPKPNSVSASPAIMPHTRSRSTSKNNKGSDFFPATPASLMRLPQHQKSSSQSEHLDESSPVYNELGSSLEDLRLPEAATPPQTSTGLVDGQNGGLQLQPSSRVNATNITPTLHSLSTRSSPVLSAVSSPINGASKQDTTRSGGRSNRRRNGGSSSLISPALRPKISPSIKPLLPEGASSMSSETHALLLASKSNYQNILEGTHPPGVTYPSELSTNLTSKRTSHKLAEQGRRNRINTALQTMQELLPPAVGGAGTPGAGAEGTSAGPDGSPNGDSQNDPKTPLTSAQQQGNSKAATVEQAIDYIKALTGRLEDREREIEGLKARLEKAEGKEGTPV